MKMTRQHKILAGVLTLGVTAVGVDRLMLGGGPEAASASSERRPDAPTASATVTPTATPASTARGTRPRGASGEAAPASPEAGPSVAVVLADRLDELASRRAAEVNLDPPRDVFLADWPAVEAPGAGTSPDTRVAEAPVAPVVSLFASDPVPFDERHTLDAVIAGGPGDRGTAVILDGRAVRVGQRVDGHLLLSASGNSAVFASESGSVRLHVRR